MCEFYLDGTTSAWTESQMLCELMGTDGNLWELSAWELMGTNGTLWELMGTYGNLWELMRTYGNLWELMGTNGSL